MKNKEIIEEMAKVMYGYICKDRPCKECNYHGKSKILKPYCEYYLKAKDLYEQGYQKIDKDSIVLSKEELKRLETNYKIGLGKSQSWCKSLKNRIEELEKENFKLKVDNEVLKEEKEQFENDNCNYEMNLQHLTGELENKGKETAEKFYKKVRKLLKKVDIIVDGDEGLVGYEESAVDKGLTEIAKSLGVEIKEN